MWCRASLGLLDAGKAVLLGRPGRPVDPQGQPLDPAQEFGDAILGYRTWPPSRPARTVPACATRLSVTSDLNPALGRPPARRIRASCSPSVVVTAWSLHAMAVKRVPAASPRRPRDTPRGARVASPLPTVPARERSAPLACRRGALARRRTVPATVARGLSDATAPDRHPIFMPTRAPHVFRFPLEFSEARPRWSVLGSTFRPSA